MAGGWEKESRPCCLAVIGALAGGCSTTTSSGEIIRIKS